MDAAATLEQRPETLAWRWLYAQDGHGLDSLLLNCSAELVRQEEEVGKRHDAGSGDAIRSCMKIRRRRWKSHG
jgi:hypothetical protein